MAPSAKHASFLLAIVLLSSLHTEARFSKFFTKTMYQYFPTIEAPTLAPSISLPPSFSPAPAPAPTPLSSDISYAPTPSEGENGYAPTPTTIESDNPYGLYGGGSTEYSPMKTTATATTTTTTSNFGNEEDEIPVGEINSERLGGFNSWNHYSNGYYNKYNNNGYSSNYYNNGYSNSGYNYNKGYTSERQGMSDTRFLENGKYAYSNVNNDQNYNQNYGYESVKGNSNTEGYYGYGEKSKYEFDSMEEYEKQQGYVDPEKFYNP